MSAQSLPAATPPTLKPPRIIRPRPPSRHRAPHSPGPLHNGSSPKALPQISNDASASVCTSIFWEPPTASLKPPALLPPSVSRTSLDSQTSPDSPSSTPSPSPVSRRSISPEPAPSLRCPHPSPLGLPEHLCPRALRLSRMALLRPLARFVDWPASLNGELKAKPSPQTPWNGVPKGARK